MEKTIHENKTCIGRRENDMRIERTNQRDAVLHMQALMGEITDEMLGDTLWNTTVVDVTLRELKDVLDTYYQDDQGERYDILA